MLEWLSDNRATVAAVLILLLLISFISSIYIGRKRLADAEKEAVFGDPERTKGGWYWSVCGVSALLLLWFYFSWGVGRAYYPCLLYTSPSPRDRTRSRMPSSA